MSINAQVKPIIQIAKGNKAAKIPVWFMRQAGRYLPEYRALRAQKNGFLDLAYDPQSACEVTMQPIRRFGMDAAILFSDILVIPHALGQKLEFLEGEGPKLDPLNNAQDLARLNFDQFDQTLFPVYETIRQVRSALRHEKFDEVALIGFAGSPWTIACYMVEGGGSRDFMKVRMRSYQQPHEFAALIDLITQATIRYLLAQIEAGAEMIQLFDSWSGVLDADSFRRWVIEPTAQIIKSLKAHYPDIPVIGFPRGAGMNYLAYQRDTGADVIGLDSFIAPELARESLQKYTPVQGNLDPLCLLAGGDQLDFQIDNILQNLAQISEDADSSNKVYNGLIFNLGHGIQKETPISHVEQALKRIRSF